MNTPPLVLFDGDCLLCSSFVHFVLDHSLEILFAPLQSQIGQDYLRDHSLKTDLSTVVLIDEDGAHLRSTAVLRVLRSCGQPYSALAVLALWLPTPLRDLGYRLVASSRYRLFGMEEHAVCRRMTAKIRHRFLAL